MSSIIYIDNDNLLTLASLTNSATDAIDVAADVTVTIKDGSGTEVAGQTWPATMAHVSAGLYRATIGEGLVLVNARTYTAHVDVVGSGGEIGRWVLPLLALRRGC